MKLWLTVGGIIVGLILLIAAYYSLKSKFVQQGEFNSMRQEVSQQVNVIQQKVDISDKKLDQLADSQSKLDAALAQQAKIASQLQQSLTAIVQLQKQQIDAIAAMKRPEVLDAILKDVGPPEPGEIQQPVLASDSQLRKGLQLITERGQCLERETVKDEQLQNCELRATTAEQLADSQKQSISELNFKMANLQEVYGLQLKEKDAEITKVSPSFLHRMFDRIAPVVIVAETVALVAIHFI